MRIKFIYRHLRKRYGKLIGNDDIAIDPGFFNYVYTKRRDLDEAFPDLEVVAIGSSLSDYGFYSPEWNESLNLGLTSSDLSVELGLYRKVLRDAPNLKIVLLYSGVFMPGFNLACSSERNRLALYKHFFGIDYNSVNRIQQSLEARIFRKLNKFTFEVKDSDQGYIYDKPHFPGFDVGARAKTHLRENQRKPDQMDYFRRLKDLVESDGREFYLVIPPVRCDYREVLKEMRDEDLFENLKSIMPADHVLDFFKHKGFTNEDFGDCDHMNSLGARKLTGMIQSRVRV